MESQNEEGCLVINPSQFYLEHDLQLIDKDQHLCCPIHIQQGTTSTKMDHTGVIVENIISGEITTKNTMILSHDQLEFQKHIGTNSDLSRVYSLDPLSPDAIPNISVSKITDLESNYAKLTAGKIDVDAIPELTTSKISDIGNYVLSSDLTTTLQGYAPLTNGKISVDVIPNLTSSAGMTIDYSLLTNTPPIVTGITKSSEMIGNFWDSDLVIPMNYSILLKNTTNYTKLDIDGLLIQKGNDENATYSLYDIDNATYGDGIYSNEE